MAKLADVTLGDTVYQIPRLNMDQLERVADLFENKEIADHKKPFRLMEIAFERVTPAVDFKGIDSEGDELKKAIEKVMEVSGMKAADPPKAPGAGAP